MRYYVAFTEPSLDHIWSYISLLIIIGVLGWYIKSTYLQKKEKSNFMVGLEELGGGNDKKIAAANANDGESVTGSVKRKREKREKKGDSTKKTGDTRDTTGNEPEPKYLTSSLRRDLDDNGPYEMTKNNNALTLDSYARYLAALNKNVWIKFHITSAAMIDKRRELYQDKQMKEYDRQISLQVTHFIKEIDKMEEKALVHL